MSCRPGLFDCKRNINETKTYGKGEAVRERKRKRTLTTLDVRAERLTVGSSSFGKDACLQVSEIERVSRYRRF